MPTIENQYKISKYHWISYNLGNGIHDILVSNRIASRHPIIKCLIKLTDLKYWNCIADTPLLQTGFTPFIDNNWTDNAGNLKKSYICNMFTSVEMVAIPLGFYSLIIILFLIFCFQKKDGEYRRSSGIRIMGLFVGVLSLIPMLMFIGCIIDLLSSFFN